MFARDRDGGRRETVVLVDGARQVPVGRGGEHGQHVAKAGPVHGGRRLGEDVLVQHERVRPAGRYRSLDAVVQQHGLVVGETVDAGRGLHDHVRHADRLADVGDRP
jgi:hypothetical protein